MSALILLDYASVLIFALTGALVASRQQLDIVGFAFIACLTAVGGGTLRDVLLDRNPIFWLGNPHYILIACGAALLVFFTAHLVESRYRLLLWLDSFALAVAVPAGVSAAMVMGQSPVIVVLMGMVTGCMGGLMRDVVCNEVPLVLKQGELYVTAAFAGALGAVGAEMLTDDPLVILGTCAALTWALRAGSLSLGWRLPVYRARPPRNRP
ncbi:MAG: trimeric intracellular cation channel family protein [Roseovarius sp.]|uniref:trimeric intracellular cation channel family protein n=1 Tax=Roseovarius sp. TaxID=1486281 RepID=UPI001B5C952E|nr:trimeric intracellular cation channel family protein [Roseovarius sp.]MBQ0748603.1 trimeric intracellular cation channel family protein [Roseovarius sp.]MBQ0808625.1 trimeric intracellular cation channel family protein [Roseovarius sp.]